MVVTEGAATVQKRESMGGGARDGVRLLTDLCRWSSATSVGQKLHPQDGMIVGNIPGGSGGDDDRPHGPERKKHKANDDLSMMHSFPMASPPNVTFNALHGRHLASILCSITWKMRRCGRLDVIALTGVL